MKPITERENTGKQKKSAVFLFMSKTQKKKKNHEQVRKSSLEKQWKKSRELFNQRTDNFGS